MTASKTLAVSQEVRDILANCTIKGNVIFLPEQLDRKLYEQTAKVLSAHGGKWKRQVGGIEFPTDPAEFIALATSSGTVVRRQQTLQMFETPRDLAKRMADWTEPKPTDTFLEPSCGYGRLAEPFTGRVAHMTLVDIDDDHTDTVASNFPLAHVVMEDFLKLELPPVDIISMNPPFSGNQDIGHILHAWRFLKPGGRLVAIVSEHGFHGKEGICVQFREFLDLIGAEIEELPPGTFKESGTGVKTRMIRARKVA